MDNMDVQRGIESKISLLEKCRQQLSTRATAKSKATAEYDKVLAVTILRMRNGEVMVHEGQKIDTPQATLIEKIAKGVCWKERLEMDTAENMYDALLTNIRCIMAELNALQSINKLNREMIGG